MAKLIHHIKIWNRWRKYNTNDKMHKFLVLIGFIHSPTMEVIERIERNEEKYKGIIRYTSITLEDTKKE